MCCVCVSVSVSASVCVYAAGNSAHKRTISLFSCAKMHVKDFSAACKLLHNLSYSPDYEGHGYLYSHMLIVKFYSYSHVQISCYSYGYVPIAQFYLYSHVQIAKVWSI